MTRVYVTKWFKRFARRERLSDKSLCEAINRAERGIIDADLGGNVIKQRVARIGSGRSGGYRTLIAIRVHQRAVFLYGFAKSARGNVSDDQVRDLQQTARDLLAAGEKAMDAAVKALELEELDCGSP